MKKYLNVFLVLAVLALFSSGCAGPSKTSGGYSPYENPGFTTNSGPHSEGYYQMFGY